MHVASRPNPQLGVFETLLVVDGQPVELDAHLERLGASLGALFDCPLPPDARDLVLDRARQFSLGRLRLTVTPESEGLKVELAAESVDPALLFPNGGEGVELCSFVVESGLGGHKWADRRLLEQAETEAQEDAVPLVLDSEGAVLEASRANVFAFHHGALLTPPADGRIIAGIARNRVLGLAEAAGYEQREERLSADDLRAADQVFLTGSVRGVERVGAIDGVALSTGVDVATELAAALRCSWLGQRQALKLP